MEVTLHFDPSCPWTWLTSRWLLRAAEVEGLEVRWAPFCLAHRDEVSGGGEGPYADAHRAARPALRVVQHLLERGDHDAVARFYDAYGDLSHRRGRIAEAGFAAEAARAAGLADEAAAAVDDASLDVAVDAVTDAAYVGAGPDVGSPILHWVDDRDQPVWIFGPLFDRLVDPPCAGEVWRGVRHLAVHSWFKELKRGRSGEPDLRSS